MGGGGGGSRDGPTSPQDASIRAVSDSVRGRGRGVEAAVTWTTIVVVHCQLRGRLCVYAGMSAVIIRTAESLRPSTIITRITTVITRTNHCNLYDSCNY